MKKKIYTAPALSVEEINSSDIVCQSLKGTKDNLGQGNSLNYVGDDSEYRALGGSARANNRGGIWNED